MNPRDFRPTSVQLARAWAAVAVFAVVAGLACMVLDRPPLTVVALDCIGIASALLAIGNWTGWLRL